ncbi:MAG: ABC transporter ATP-binding protein [Clostridiales bacterium]|jgi:oligopeptide transport system ATP-binding protein|nr:ABC transporter ATP-binding protein [Clostridiales bacterium]MDR2751246.1 ABC transporter ATP-binding protein [Clostridiales bacterium]
MANSLLEMDDLRISFFTPAGEVKAVNGMSCALNQGEVLGIVGESGSGKSVSVTALMKLLVRPGKVVGGGIKFDGRDILAMSSKEMRGVRGKDISMIFQDPMTSLNPVFTIGNQLIETIRTHTGMPKKEAADRGVKMLAQVGINNPEKRMKQFPHELSGGMRQRVMIAMALSCSPKLLIADEPTTSLDVTIQAQILDLIKKMRDETGAAVILITHDLGIVSEICDRIMIMYAGRIVESGSVDDIYYSTAHPYTKGLLGCLPGSSKGVRAPLKAIEGNPVDLLDMPKGCGFASRCGECMKICLRENPPSFPIGEGHVSACWKHVPVNASEVRP